MQKLLSLAAGVALVSFAGIANAADGQKAADQPTTLTVAQMDVPVVRTNPAAPAAPSSRAATTLATPAHPPMKAARSIMGAIAGCMRPGWL